MQSSDKPCILHGDTSQAWPCHTVRRSSLFPRSAAAYFTGDGGRERPFPLRKYVSGMYAGIPAAEKKNSLLIFSSVRKKTAAAAAALALHTVTTATEFHNTLMTWSFASRSIGAFLVMDGWVHMRVTFLLPTRPPTMRCVSNPL